jgi:hypothetical protein
MTKYTFLLLAAAITWYLSAEISSLCAERDILLNNVSAYRADAHTLSREKGVFLVSMEKLRKENDSLAARVKKLVSEQGIKSKQGCEVSTFESHAQVDTVVTRDTVFQGIDLHAALPPNDYTTLQVDIKEGALRSCFQSPKYKL